MPAHLAFCKMLHNPELGQVVTATGSSNLLGGMLILPSVRAQTFGKGASP
jgi:hypothetical protein